MDCSYCSTATIEGRALRKRSPELVARWMGDHVAKGFRRFFFTDNTFNLPPSYARKLCRRISAEGLDISWNCIIYPVRLDEDLVKDMAHAGCTQVSLGSESGNEQVLRSLNKRFKPDDIRYTSDLFKKYGIARMGFLMLGGPGETKESVEESFAFADSLDLEMLKLVIGIRIYPYTALARVAVEEGIVAPDDDLLFPRFYIRKEIEDWIRQTAKEWVAKRPNWVM
jgi:radical SAM superfamily enzyme YgiQ (UPF0313 family)